MAYCEPGDLLVGDMPVPPNKAEQFIAAASDEIDAVLGVRFVMPPGPDVDPSATLTLKRCCALLATGRLVMAQAVGGEDTTTHAYGTYLLREGHQLLTAMADGEILLIGVDPRPEYASSGNAPSIIYEDTYAAVASFYDYVVQGANSRYAPGL